MQPPGTEGSESVQPDARHRVSVAAQDRLMCERPFPASLASRRLSDRTVEDGGETVLCLLSVVKEGLWPWRSFGRRALWFRRTLRRAEVRREAHRKGRPGFPGPAALFNLGSTVVSPTARDTSRPPI